MKVEKNTPLDAENRITEHQLSKIRTFEESFRKGSEMIGNLTLQYEFQKSSLLSQITDLDKDYTKFKEDLKEQYGEVEIDTSTGIYTVKETEDK
jgi:hypothetical protein